MLFDCVSKLFEYIGTIYFIQPFVCPLLAGNYTDHMHFRFLDIETEHCTWILSFTGLFYLL